MRVLKRATPTVTRGIRLKWSFLRTRDTHTYCRAFTCSSGDVNTCFYDLGLSQLGFKNPTFWFTDSLSRILRILYDCLCAWGFSSRSRFFLLILRRQHYWRRAENFDLCPALVINEKWWFFSVPHLMLHGASVWHSHLLPSVWQFRYHFLFYDLGLSRL